MSALVQKIRSDKRGTRKQRAALPFAEKLIILEKLRDRSLLIASSPLGRAFRGRTAARTYRRTGPEGTHV